MVSSESLSSAPLSLPPQQHPKHHFRVSTCIPEWSYATGRSHRMGNELQESLNELNFSITRCYSYIGGRKFLPSLMKGITSSMTERVMTMPEADTSAARPGEVVLSIRNLSKEYGERL